PLRLPGLASGSVTVMSIKSKMMGTTLMSVLAVVYDGRREALTLLLSTGFVQQPLAGRQGVG
ncbi:hypothetical protein, partial [Paraburkholderia sp. NMBU_R16]|uniref:hypothetical protein n=1 Tax=Paraburkholderia sp. NMBU_R16 TaxID=2698676 RepID=UPI001C275026